MPPSKRKKSSFPSGPDDDQITVPDIAPRSSTSLSGKDQDVNNVGKGLAKLPPEMMPEIISWYHSVEDDSTLVNNNQSRDPLVQGTDSNSKKKTKHRSPGCIPLIFSERTNVLRALSATCRTYRIIFLPFLWDRLDICFAPRTWANDDDVNAEAMEPVYREVSESMIRKCNGILENPHLAPMIRCVASYPFHKAVETDCFR
jgi:hypothetical protein